MFRVTLTFVSRKLAGTFVIAILSGSCLSGLLADEVPWLSLVTTPVTIPAESNHGVLKPVLESASGKVVSSVADWNDVRRQLRDQWMRFLGPMPEPRPGNQFRVLEENSVTGCRRQLIEYDAEPGIPVQAWLLYPDNDRGVDPAGLRPGIVALHPTTNDSIDEIAGIRGRELSQTGLMLARRGFVVICPRCFLWQDAESLDDAVRQHRTRHPATLGMAKMLYDAVRATDVLASLPGVDPTRLGAFGHSLGAKETLYLAAFDDRIRAAVASEGGLGFRSTNWDAAWYLGPAIRDEQFPLNHHQLLAMIAPRPFLIAGGESGPGAADGDRSWPVINAALPAWKLYGEPVRLGLLNHHEGHRVSPATFERIVEWMNVYLSPRP